MTHRKIVQAVRVTERVERAMLVRLLQRGPIIVVHAAGEFAKTNGAKFMTVLTAFPDEDTDACIARHGFITEPNDCVFDFNFNPILSKEK